MPGVKRIAECKVLVFMEGTEKAWCMALVASLAWPSAATNSQNFWNSFGLKGKLIEQTKRLRDGRKLKQTNRHAVIVFLSVLKTTLAVCPNGLKTRHFQRHVRDLAFALSLSLSLSFDAPIIPWNSMGCFASLDYSAQRYKFSLWRPGIRVATLGALGAKS